MKMSAEIEDDSSDSDCFILKEIKPVKKTFNKSFVKQTPILMYCNVSNASSPKRNIQVKEGKTSSKHSDDIKSKKKQSCFRFGVTNSKGKIRNSVTDLNIKCIGKSSNICGGISSEGVEKNSSVMCEYDVTQDKKGRCCSTELEKAQEAETCSPPRILNSSDKSRDTGMGDNIQLSPGISRKRKRFIINDITSKSTSPEGNGKKPLLKMLNEIGDNEQSLVKEVNIEMSSNATESDIVKDNSAFLCILLKKMIRDEIKKQMNLKEQSLRNGKIVEELLQESEKEILDKFFNLKESACRVFVRMLGRKKCWHRVCDINYKEISNNLGNEFVVLHKENYVDINVEDEDLKTQIDLLKKADVLGLCKVFNVSLKFNNSSRKQALIDLLIQECQKQKSALEMFSGRNSNSRLDRLKSEVKKCLGMCVRLNNRTFLTFHKILVLSSFAHYFGEEDKRFNNELLRNSQFYKNLIKFPNYRMSPTVVFENRVDFEEYLKALLLQDSLEVAMNDKNYEEFVTVCMKAKEEFKKLLKNNGYLRRFSNLKPFLKKFSAGTIYARILTKYCTTFKKRIDNLQVMNTAGLLLNQNLFLTRKKGEWYEILSQIYKNQMQSNTAAEIIIRSLKDPHVNEVQKLALQLRGHLILKKQKCGVSDIHIREMLNDVCTLSVKEPPSIEIKGRALGENESGYKCVYVQESQNGKIYTTVEERAISYYKSVGFTKGFHSEGLIVQTIYFLLFYDIIYGLAPEGVFQSPFQEAPLDFRSSSFYENRKEEIDIFLSDMSGWDNKEIEEKIRDAYDRHFGTVCLIRWSEELTSELFCEVAKCITVPILILIFQRFARNFREVQAGFPDLTLWNTKTNRCKFVEVKSPSDRLSPAQKVWLDFLINIGLDCEVCNVKNVSGKSL